MNLQSLVGSLRRKAFTNPATRTRPRKPNLRLRIEELERREVPAVIPSPIVSQTSHRSIDDTAWAPAIAADPTNPNRLFAAFATPGGNGTRIALRYSTDGGITWADRLRFIDPILGGNRPELPNGADPVHQPPPVIPFEDVTDPSVAWDRFGNVYVAYTEHHSPGDSAGRVVLRKFSFNTPGSIGTPVPGDFDPNALGTQSLRVLYAWFNSTRAYNVNVAIDTNLGVFDDPDVAGAPGNQNDDLAAVQNSTNNLRIFVTWNTDVRDADNNNPANINPNVILGKYSDDGGATFSAPLNVSDGRYDVNRGPFVQSKIAFTPGRAGENNSGGRMVTMWTSNRGGPNNTPTIFADTLTFDDATTGVPQNVIVSSPNTVIIDIDNDAPDITTIPITVPAGTGVDRLDNMAVKVNVNFDQSDLSHLYAELQDPFGNVHTLWFNRSNAAGQDATDGRGLDGEFMIETILTDSAFFPVNAGEEPYTGDFLAEGSLPFIGSGTPPLMSTFGGINPAGVWILRVIDFVDDDQLGTIQVDLILGRGVSNGFATDRGTGAAGPVHAPAAANITGTAHPTTQPYSPVAGVGPGLAVAVDNTLGAFSPFQNRVYMAYSTGNQIRLMYSDNGGVEWNTTPINVGQGFLPALTVDETTGTLVMAYYTSRFDAANARTTPVIQTSINGADFKDRFGTIELSPAAFVTPKEEAFDQIRSKVIDVEPVPSNGPASLNGEMWGNNLGLAVFNGRVNLVHTGNLNFAGSQLRTQNLRIAAGPRIVRGDMGPILGPARVPGITGSVSYNNTVTTDGRDPFTGFVVEFDRVIQPSSFTTGEVKVVFHSPTDDPAGAGTPVQVTDVEPLDDIQDPIDDSSYGSRRFLISVAPQTAVGTYSYLIGANSDGDISGIRDRVRSRGLTFIPSGTPVTKNDNPAPPVEIVDFASFPTPLVRTLTVAPADFPPGTVVGDVQVSVNITHPFVSDLRLELIAPNGQIITLVNEGDAVPGQEDYPGTTFSDGGTDLIINSTPPYTGTYKPVRPFSDLFASLIVGNWQLRITDLAAGDTGFLNSWSLVVSGVTASQGTVLGNLIDQDADGNENEAAFLDANNDLRTPDGFTIPDSTTDIPFRLPYEVGSLPIVIPGPRLVGSRVAGQPQTTENLVKDTTAKSIDLEFDRRIDTTTFNATDILRITGPLGDIALNGVTVTPIDALNGLPTTGNSRFYRIGFAEQKLSGSYVIQLSSQIQDTEGNLLDTNTNAGVGNLLGTVTDADVEAKFYPSQVVAPVAIPAKGSATVVLNIAESYQLKRALVHMTLNHTDTRQLEGRLVAPDGTTVLLFANAPRNGNDDQGFQNTTFDDAATTPVQEGGSGFSGSFNPTQPLAQLIDHGSRGTWRLIITNTGTTTGEVNSFALTFDKPVVGTGLGEEVGDRTAVSLRISQTDPTTATAKGNWSPVGPAPQLYNGGVDSTAGRVGALSVDPSDPSGNTVYAAGASGGVWRTTNFLTRDLDGPSWVPLTDFGPNNAINIGSLAVYNTSGDPNTSIIVVGTGSDDLNEIAKSEFRRSSGDPNANGEQEHRFDGVGFLISEDAGKTWQVLDSTNNFDFITNQYRSVTDGARDHLFVGAVVNRIVIEPLRDQFSQRPIIYAAIGRGGLTGAAGDAAAGLWRSRDGGRTWTKIVVADQTNPPVPGDVTDFLFGQGSELFNSDGRPSFAYVAIRGQGVFFTSNLDSPEPAFELMDRAAGRPFLQNLDPPPGPTGPVPVNAPTDTPNGAKGRIVLAAPSLVPGDTLANNYYQRWLYAAVARPDGTFDGLYMTKDRGYNWTKVKLTQGGGFNDTLIDIDPTFHDEVTPSNRFAGGNHSLTLAVDPNDPNIVYFGTDSLIKVDTTLIDDPYNITLYNGGQADGGQQRPTTIGAVANNTAVTEVIGLGLNAFDPLRRVNSLTPGQGTNSATYNAALTAVVRRRWNHLNSDRDPYNPFVVDTTLTSNNLQFFTNTGGDVRWVTPGGGLAMVEGDYNWVSQIVTIRDPLTGLGRLIFGHDEGIASYVPQVNPSPNAPTGAVNSVIGITQDYQLQGSTALRNNLQITDSRNGNLQVARLYSGDAQPSLLSASISGSLLYGAARRLGDIQVSDENVLGNGGITWTDDGRNPPFLPEGGRANYVAADQVGKGKIYILRRVNDLPFEGEFRTDFFQVMDNGNAPISRTNGLFQSPTDGQWTNRVRRFAVNTALRTPSDTPAIIMGSDVGRLFRTRDDGRNWNAIAEPARLDGSYLSALAFGAPQASDTNADDHIYVGSENGNIFVTLVGGGNLPTSWTNITTGSFGALDGSDIMKIVPNPQRDSHELFVVTKQGVYYMPDWTAAGAVWQNITTDILTISSTGFGNAAWRTQVTSTLDPLMTIAVDWRPTYSGTVGTPILYVGGDGGVFRAVYQAEATTWSRYTGPVEGSASDGGGMPVVKVTDLDLALGNIDSNTGRVLPNGNPAQLVATTLGRGTWVTAIDVPPGVSGPRVIEFDPTVPQFDPITSVTIKFDSFISVNTFTTADVTIVGPSGESITPTQVVDITNPPGGQTNLHNEWRIDFPALVADGTYTITVGPDVRSGPTPMDQDGDANNGEASDAFVMKVVIGLNDLADYVKDTYQALLGRLPSTAEFGATQVKNLEKSRLTALGVIVREFLSTFNANEARKTMIGRFFDNGNAAGEIGHLLPGYQLPTNERDFYVNALKNGTKTPEGIIVDIIATTDVNKGFYQDYFVAAGGSPLGFVQKLYQDLFKGTGIQFGWLPQATQTTQLNQAATPNGRLTLTRNLVNGALVRYTDPATPGVQQTTDFRAHLVQLAYQKYLGRAATPAEVTAGKSLIARPLAANSIQGSEWLYWKVLSSLEYFNRVPAQADGLPDDGLHTNRGWIQAVINDRMFRASTSLEEDTYSKKVLDRFKTQRAAFVNSIVNSATTTMGLEYREREITAYFQLIHSRNPNETELATAQNSLKNGSTYQGLRSARFASTEFYQTNAPQIAGGTVSPATWARAVYLKMFNRLPTPAEQTALASKAGTISSRQTAVLALHNGVAFRDILITSRFQLLLGRLPTQPELTAYQNFLKTRRWEALIVDIIANGNAAPVVTGGLPRQFWEVAN